MTSVANIDFSEAPLCEVVIATSRAIRNDFPADAVNAQLQALVEEARDYVSSVDGPDLRLEKLLELFYKSGNSAAPAASTNCRTCSGWITY